MNTSAKHYSARSHCRASALLLLIFMLIFGSLPLRAQFVNSHSVFGSGGTSSANDVYTMQSTAGQTFTGTMLNGTLTISAGFWHVAGTATVPTSIDRENNLDQLPLEFMLHQNYPNPFNPTTNIRFDLPVESPVVVDVYTITGQLVMRLINETRPAGTHTATFDAGRLTSGVYLYRLQAGTYSATGKMMLLK
jgi:hypothetical protein